MRGEEFAGSLKIGDGRAGWRWRRDRIFGSWLTAFMVGRVGVFCGYWLRGYWSVA